MTENPEFDLDTELLVPESEPRPELEPDAPAQSAPVVMIQYRNRGVPPLLLFPITLILSLGMFAAYHYLFVAPRQRELQERARIQARAASALDAVKAEPSEEKASAPLMGLSLDSQPLPPGFQIPLPPPSFEESETTRVAAKPVDKSEANGEPTEPSTTQAAAAEPRKEPAPPPMIGFSPPSDVTAIEPTEPEDTEGGSPAPAAPSEAAKENPAVAALAAVTTPEPKPSPTREEMMRALEAEAQVKHAARAEKKMTRDEARERVEIEARDRVDTERELFHDALRRILAAGGPTSDVGQQIDALCEQFGRTYGGELKSQVLAALSRSHGKVSRDHEVNMLRSFGVPEAGVLDYLANVLERRSINSRNGPGTQDGVRILAAKQLLRAKLSSNATRDAPSAPARVEAGSAIQPRRRSTGAVR